MAETDIEWADRVWNFLRGCTMISPGCQHCYAMQQAHRFNYAGGAYEGLTEMGPEGPRWNGTVRFIKDKLREPLTVKAPKRWFVNSMSDLFHKDVEFDQIDQAFAIMAQTPHHTYQILTKRSETMRIYSNSVEALSPVERSMRMLRAQYKGHPAEHVVLSGIDPANVGPFPWPLPNVWLGVSVEDQVQANRRVQALLDTPAAVRWVSYEPALELVDLTNLSVIGHSLDALEGEWYSSNTGCAVSDKTDNRLDWIVVGGESGPHARPFNINWARFVVRQCKTAGVACFVKQVGAKPYACRESTKGRFRDHVTCIDEGFEDIRDPKGGDMSEWPEDLRVREFPRHPPSGESVA
jgi:protein gp37